MGKGRAPRLRLRVPFFPRPGRLPDAPPRLRRDPGGLQPQVPEVPPEEVPPAPGAEGRGVRVRPALPREGGQPVVRGRHGRLPLRRLRCDADDLQGPGRRRPPVGEGPEALQEPLFGENDEVRVHRRPVPDDGPGRRDRPRLRARWRPDRRLRTVRAGAAASSLLRPEGRPPRADSGPPRPAALSRVLARREDDRLRRDAERQARHLHARPRHEDGPKPLRRPGLGRSAGLLSRRKVHLPHEADRGLRQDRPFPPWTTPQRSSR